jgi:SAM-dependent methyltransferase
MKRAVRLLCAVATREGPQNYLGARWVRFVLGRYRDPKARRKAALRLLALSPHYFYSTKPLWFRMNELELESARNHTSREVIANEILGRYLHSTDVALDYGCGPGYLAFVVSEMVAGVVAVDISQGVLECAQALHGAPNIEYVTPDHLDTGFVDVAYSFAVMQHLSRGSAELAFRKIAGALKPGGRAVIHVVVDCPGWHSEQEWLQDRSFRGRFRYRYGLHCFKRSFEEYCAIMQPLGFTDIQITPAASLTTVADDISLQQIITAVKSP